MQTQIASLEGENNRYATQSLLCKYFLLKILVNKGTAKRREISVYTLSCRWCILLNLACSAHKNETLCYL